MATGAVPNCQKLWAESMIKIEPPAARRTDGQNGAHRPSVFSPPGKQNDANQMRSPYANKMGKELDLQKNRKILIKRITGVWLIVCIL